MAEMSEAFLRAANLALEADSTAVVDFMEAEASMAVVADIGKRKERCTELVTNSRMKGTTMSQNIHDRDQLKWKNLIRFAAFGLIALSLGALSAPTTAQQADQQNFASVADAGRAFFTAMQAPDDHSILKILGPAGKDIISSGDPIED